MERRDDTELKVFNAAKKFAEEILFPLMEQYQSYQKQSDFGATTLLEANVLSEEIRDIQRYNGLKAMADCCSNLIRAIESTVRLKGNREEIAQLNKLVEIMEDVKNLFYNHKERFFDSFHKQGMITEAINRLYFERVKKIIQVSYVNTEILMTRNKLLFADASDEFATDAEIMDEIKREYIES